jgi:hypothetical protein
MIRIGFIVLFLFTASVFQSQAQKKECKQKPKRFPSAFTQMSTDYANMNLQTDIIPKRYFQLESSLSLGALFINKNGEKYFGYNSNLIRIGLVSNVEIRPTFSIPGHNVEINNTEIEHLHPPVGIGVKVNLLSESSVTPGIAINTEYIYYDLTSHFQACLIIDKLAFKVLKLSLSAGPQISVLGTSKMVYSSGIVMKDRNKKFGVYALANNRYAYLENIFNMGLVYSDNLNYNFTIGYGVHQNVGLFVFSYTGLINYNSLQRRYGAYFR